MTRMHKHFPITAMIALLTALLITVMPAAAQLEAFDELMDQAIDVYFEGDYQEALDIINEALASTDDDVARSFALDWRGWIYYILGDDERALEDLNEAIDISGDDADPIYYVDRALIYAIGGNNREALADYELALELDSSYAFNADTLVSTDSFDFLIENYTIANDARKDNYIILAFRGTLYANIGSYDEAIADYERALELNPSFTVVEQALEDVRDAQENGIEPEFCNIEGTGVIPLLQYGVAVEGSISSETPYELFCINVASTPATIEARMTRERGSLEPVVALYVFGTNLAFSEPTTGDEATVEAEITVPGLYTVLVGREDFEEGRTTGDYSLTVEITGAGGQITLLPNGSAS